jgi:hypothetical protein
MILPPPPPSPPRDSAQCTGQPGIVLLTDGSAFEEYAADRINEIQGPQKTWVDGNVRETTIGAKTEVTKGDYTEIDVVNKTEVTTLTEGKFGYGTCNEVFMGIKLLVHRADEKDLPIGGKLEIKPGETEKVSVKRTDKVATARETLAKAKEVIQNFEESVMGPAKEEHAQFLLEADSLETQLDKLAEAAAKYYVKAKAFTRSSKKFNRVVNGNEEHEVGTFECTSKGRVELTSGAKVEIEGGGNKVELTSKATANGTEIVVTK